jgi:protein TonB
VIAFLLASLLAVPAIEDTTSALPGTLLRFGMESGRFGATQGFQPTPRPQPPEQQERAGAMRFFGIDATATLSFIDRRLAQAQFVIESASPQQISYIDDDLVRRGYRRRCMVREGGLSQCTWTGATRVDLNRQGGRITAIIRPLTREERHPGAGPEAAPAAGGTTGTGVRPAAGPAAPATPMHPDTLALPPGWTQEDFLVEWAPAPRYPAAARDAGVQGVVRMLALVDTSGAVTDVRIMRGIAELDSAAVAVALGMRFRPFVHDGRRVGAWVRIPVTFTLH